MNLHLCLSIFPADAGVNLINAIMVDIVENIPRGCGGEPNKIAERDRIIQYSPRMRG